MEGKETEGERGGGGERHNNINERKIPYLVMLGGHTH
jgi:hypothetical protein